jgi:hypothetical protein
VSVFIVRIKLTDGTIVASLIAILGKRSDYTQKSTKPPIAGIKDANISALCGFEKNA